MKVTNSIVVVVLLSLVCAAFAAPCGTDDKGLLVGSDCLCESGFAWDAADCTAETTSCSIPVVDDLNSPGAISLGAGVTEDSFVLNINVPFEETRILTVVKFDDVDTSDYDYPAAFADYTRAVTESTCSDTFSIIIPNSDMPATITRTTAGDGSSVEYAGTVYVTSVETLSDGSTRTISQILPFDYTFPIVTASIANIDVVSSIGTVLKSNILQQATGGGSNEIQLVIQLSTPFPYQLDFLDKAPITGTKFTGTDVVVPVHSPVLTYTVSPASACSTTAQGQLCVQTATVNIDYSTGCSIDGSYTLNFAVTGCNSAGGSTPSIDCLTQANGDPETIPVTVTISSLKMGNLCLEQKEYNAAASDLVVYADNGFTVIKNKFIADDTNQADMFLKSELTIGPDTLSVDAYQGFQIVSVSRMCAGVSTCTGSYVDFDPADVTAYTVDNFNVEFSVPVSAFDEITPSVSDIPYSIRVSLALLFSDNSKRSMVLERKVLQSVATQASGSVQFIAAASNGQQTTTDTKPDAQNDEHSAASITAPSVSALSIAALCVAAVALVATI